MTQPAYCSAAHIRDAADIPYTTQADRAIARAIDDASRSIERLCRGRRFYPTTGTRTIDFPDTAGVNLNRRRVWLDENELLSVSALSAGGSAITAYRLGGNDQGQGPYRWIETDYDTGQVFTSGSTGHQDAISVTGVFGYTTDTTPAGTLTAAISDTTSTAIAVSSSLACDIGDAILVDSEWMIVTGRGPLVDALDTLPAALAIDSTDAAITVADGTLYEAGELLQVGTERLEVVSVAGNTITVARAARGTTLAAHTLGDVIYADRARTVERGALGTTAATHSNGAAVARLTPPAPVVSLAIAETLVLLAQERAGWARTVGQGESEREARGAGIEAKRKAVGAQYRPKGAVFAAGAGWS